MSPLLDGSLWKKQTKRQQMFSLLEGDTMRLVCYDVNYFFFCSTLLLMKYEYCHGVHISEVRRWDK